MHYSILLTVIMIVAQTICKLIFIIFYRQSEVQSERYQPNDELTFSKNIKNIQNEIFNKILKAGNENSSVASNSAASSGAKNMSNKYNIPELDGSSNDDRHEVFYSPEHRSNILNILNRHPENSDRVSRSRSPLKNLTKHSDPHCDIYNSSPPEKDEGHRIRVYNYS